MFIGIIWLAVWISDNAVTNFWGRYELGNLLSEFFYYQLMYKRIVLKGVLKFTLNLQ